MARQEAILELPTSRNIKKIPRCELWIGRKIFEHLRLEDNIKSRFILCSELGMDYTFLSLSIEGEQIKPFGYRSFNILEIENAIGQTRHPCGIILDGPFQRLYQKQGIVSTLSLLSETEKFKTKLKNEVALLISFISLFNKQKFEIIVLADDIAYQKATYMNPKIFEMLFTPYYREIVNAIHEIECLAFFHSDGNVTQIFPDLVNCGFDGFAGCQWECMDIISLKKMANVVFMAGIDFPLLESATFNAAERKEWLQFIKELSGFGGFILSSSCGIHTLKHLKNLKRLYQCIDASNGDDT